MRIDVDRAKAVLPPVDEVTLTLSPQEAEDLWYLSGRISFNSLIDLGCDKEYAERIRRMVTVIYTTLQDHGFQESTEGVTTDGRFDR